MKYTSRGKMANLTSRNNEEKQGEKAQEMNGSCDDYDVKVPVQYTGLMNT